MKIKLQSPVIFFLILSVLILSCGPASEALLTPANTDLPSAATPTLLPTVTSTPTLPPTVAPTATVYPPVFNPAALGDNRVLDSFIMTITRTDSTTGGGKVTEFKTTSGYIKEPLSAYYTGGSFSGSAPASGKYWIGGWTYTTTGSVDWMILRGADPEGIDSFMLYEGGDMRYWMLDILSAQFVGEEDYEGIPAYHFTFDEADLEYTERPDDGYKIDKAEGEIFLSQDGNYVLYYHFRLTGNIVFDYVIAKYTPGVHEVTEGLSSINQLTEIALPSEYLEAQQTLVNLDLPLPAGATLNGMRRWSGSAVNEYFYVTTMSYDEFIEFYESMTPTNGWTFSHIGQIRYNNNCDTTYSGTAQDCVTLIKGGEQILLYYSEGFIGAEYEK